MKFSIVVTVVLITQTITSLAKAVSEEQNRVVEEATPESTDEVRTSENNKPTIESVEVIDRAATAIGSVEVKEDDATNREPVEKTSQDNFETSSGNHLTNKSGFSTTTDESDLVRSSDRVSIPAEVTDTSDLTKKSMEYDVKRNSKSATEGANDQIVVIRSTEVVTEASKTYNEKSAESLNEKSVRKDLLLEEPTGSENEFRNAEDLLSEEPTESENEFRNAEGLISEEPTESENEFRNAEGLLLDEPTESENEFRNAEGLLPEEPTESENEFRNAKGLLSEEPTESENELTRNKSFRNDVPVETKISDSADDAQEEITLRKKEAEEGIKRSNIGKGIYVSSREMESDEGLKRESNIEGMTLPIKKILDDIDLRTAKDVDESESVGESNVYRADNTNNYGDLDVFGNEENKSYKALKTAAHYRENVFDRKVEADDELKDGKHIYFTDNDYDVQSQDSDYSVREKESDKVLKTAVNTEGEHILREEKSDKGFQAAAYPLDNEFVTKTGSDDELKRTGNIKSFDARDNPFNKAEQISENFGDDVSVTEKESDRGPRTANTGNLVALREEGSNEGLERTPHSQENEFVKETEVGDELKDAGNEDTGRSSIFGIESHDSDNFEDEVLVRENESDTGLKTAEDDQDNLKRSVDLEPEHSEVRSENSYDLQIEHKIIDNKGRSGYETSSDDTAHVKVSENDSSEMTRFAQPFNGYGTLPFSGATTVIPPYPYGLKTPRCGRKMLKGVDGAKRRALMPITPNYSFPSLPFRPGVHVKPEPIPMPHLMYPNQDTYYPKQDTFYPKQDTYYPKQDTFYPKQDSYYPSQVTYYPNQDAYRPKERLVYPDFPRQQYNPKTEFSTNLGQSYQNSYPYQPPSSTRTSRSNEEFSSSLNHLFFKLAQASDPKAVKKFPYQLNGQHPVSYSLPNYFRYK